MSADVKEHITRNIPRYMQNTCEKYCEIIRDNYGDLFPGTEHAIAKQWTASIMNHSATPPAEFDDYIDLQDAYMYVPKYRIQGRSRGITTQFLIGVTRFSRWLSEVVHAIEGRTWSLFPLGSQQIRFFDIDTRCLWALLRSSFLQDRSQAFPPRLITANHRFVSLPNFEQDHRSLVRKQEFWEDIMDIDHIQRRRWWYGASAENLAGSPIRFAFFIRTDGYTAHALFERPKTNNGEEYPATRNELQKLLRDMDVGAWQTGIYHLSKRPQGLDAIHLQNSRIVGIDPGKRTFITGVSDEQPIARNNIIEIPGRFYHIRLNVPTFLEFQDYITTLSHCHQKVVKPALVWIASSNLAFGKAVCSSGHYTGIIGTYSSKHASSANGWERDHRPCIIALGSANIPHMKTFSPLPQWLFAKNLARHVLVDFVDEYKTSITCAFDNNELIPCRDMNSFQCEHKKTRFRSLAGLNNGRGRKKLACKDEDPSSECPDARLILSDKPSFAPLEREQISYIQRSRSVRAKSMPQPRWTPNSL
ncbi:hypothetical protein VTP01DRAFT_10036 [Rhizomucor pusillus]|uniref:uncharacterized protein n=1 Tax=Rhizomucor pusillus TaxID=4840 RepID=UPI00374424EC